MSMIEHVPLLHRGHVPTAGDVFDVLLKECCLQSDAVQVRVPVLGEHLLTAVQEGKASNGHLVIGKNLSERGKLRRPICFPTVDS